MEPIKKQIGEGEITGIIKATGIEIEHISMGNPAYCGERNAFVIRASVKLHYEIELFGNKKHEWMCFNMNIPVETNELVKNSFVNLFTELQKEANRALIEE